MITRFLPQTSLLVVALAASVALSACGGGGSDSGTPAVNNNAPVTPASSPVTPATQDSNANSADTPVTPVTPDDGQKSADNSGNNDNSNDNNDSKDTGNDTPPTPPVADNVVPITIATDDVVGRVVNMPYVSVKFCVPGAQGASQCAVVDHMLLDTGSVGVRVMSSALGALAARLPAQSGASNDPDGTAPIAECALFASGYTWGPIRKADIGMGGKTASNLPVQVIGDSAYASSPMDCSTHGIKGMNSTAMLGANGIVGISHLAHDNPDAAQALIAASYYYCPKPSTCTTASVPLDKQTAHPVPAFATDNNGTIIRLPALPPMGQASVSGELVFGIGTRANNALPDKPTMLNVSDRGIFTTFYKQRWISSVIDSGSNGLFFADSSIPVSLGWFAPALTQNLSAVMMSNTGDVQLNVPFSIANAANLFAIGYAAHDNLGANMTSLFLWGLPFFYGRNVYTALSGAQAGPQTGPYVAF